MNESSVVILYNLGGTQESRNFERTKNITFDMFYSIDTRDYDVFGLGGGGDVITLLYDRTS